MTGICGQQLRSLNVPTLVVHGEEESIPMDLVEEWVTSMPHARLLKVPRAAHFTYAERPELVWPAVEKFLASLAEPSPDPVPEPPMIIAIIVGLIAGFLAGKIMNESGYGILIDLVLGLLGGIFGSLVLGLVGIGAYGSSDRSSSRRSVRCC